MHSKLIPTANEKSFEEIVYKLRRIEKIASEFGIVDFSIDVSDGTFAPTTVWHEPKDLVGLKTDLALEIHLMIDDVDTRIRDWLVEPVSRIVFHLEAAENPLFVLDEIKKSGKKSSIAINPETPVEHMSPFFGKADSFLILGVNPGESGQKMLPQTVDKIRSLRKMCPECIIEVDGGVTLENAKNLVKAGANHIVAASAIFGENDIGQSIKNLQTVINKNQ